MSCTTEVLDLVRQVKANGTFDQFRKECLAEMEAKPAFQTLKSQVESFIHEFLSEQTWNTQLKKAELREHLRKRINDRGILTQNVDLLVNDVVDNKIDTIFRPLIAKLVDNPFTQVSLAKFCQVDDTTKCSATSKTSPIDNHMIKRENKKQNSELTPLLSTPPPPPPPPPSPPQSSTTTNTTTATSENKIQLKKTLPKQIHFKTASTTKVIQHQKSIEETLRVDPKHEYNFDWKLDIKDIKSQVLFDELSASSVSTSDLSDYNDEEFANQEQAQILETKVVQEKKEEVEEEEGEQQEEVAKKKRQPVKLVGSAKRKRTLNPKYYS